MNIEKAKIQLANKFFESRVIRRIFPEVGRIKIGEKRPYQKDGKVIYLPQKIDHFVITKNVRDESGNFVPDVELMKKVASITNQSPDKLLQIPVVFPFEMPELNFQIWLICFSEGKLLCKGDGSSAIRFQQDGTSIMMSCPCERLNYPEDTPGKCKAYGRLNCFIKGAPHFGGVWVFRTTSLRTIETIWRQMKQFFSITGGLSGFVFLLNLNQEKVLLKSTTRTIYTVSLLYDPSYDDLSDSPLGRLFEKGKIRRERIAEKLEEERKMLSWYSSAILEEEEKAEKDIQEEFFPKSEIQEIIKAVEEENVEETHESSTGEEPEEVKIKPANPAQINIIRRELGKYLAQEGINPDEDPYLSDMEFLSFDEAVNIIKMLKNREYAKAYSLLKTGKKTGTTVEDEEKKITQDELKDLEELYDSDLEIEEVEDNDIDFV